MIINYLLYIYIYNKLHVSRGALTICDKSFHSGDSDILKAIPFVQTRSARPKLTSQTLVLLCALCSHALHAKKKQQDMSYNLLVCAHQAKARILISNTPTGSLSGQTKPTLPACSSWTAITPTQVLLYVADMVQTMLILLHISKGIRSTWNAVRVTDACVPGRGWFRCSWVDGGNPGCDCLLAEWQCRHWGSEQGSAQAI